MPFGMIRIMPGRTPLAMIALTTGRAMQHDLARPGSPVFINKKVMHLRRSRGSLGDQPRFSGNF